MNCSKTYTINGKRITVSWCALGLLAILVTAFIVVERMYGPF